MAYCRCISKPWNLIKCGPAQISASLNYVLTLNLMKYSFTHFKCSLANQVRLRQNQVRPHSRKVRLQSYPVSYCLLYSNLNAALLMSSTSSIISSKSLLASLKFKYSLTHMKYIQSCPGYPCSLYSNLSAASLMSSHIQDILAQIK